MKKLWIIDPSSIEENRGSFAYMPYYLYAAMQDEYQGNVELLEDFTITRKEELEAIQPGDGVLISLWSYPQIDLCRILNLRLPQAFFFGYTPLIRELKLPVYDPNNDVILEGIVNYSKYVSKFDHLLLSDCDGHLKNKPEVFPLCTSYGCPRNCSFCPVTPTLRNKRRIIAPIDKVLESLDRYQDYCPDSGVHFTDEDFFFDTDRAKEILWRNSVQMHNIPVNPSLIALASVDTFTRFLDSFEDDADAQHFCEETGLYLVEIGMESADKELAAHMGKPSFDKCEALAKRVKGWNLRILWLSLTFSPGETINSIAENGKFLKQHGLDPTEMSPRIRTNGTEGGLGQFFQLYTGTRDYEKASLEGEILTDRQTRLIPSFIPCSLMECTIEKVRDWSDSDVEWLDLYGAPKIRFFDGESVERMLKVLPYPKYRSIISVAVAARLGVIKQG